MDKIAQQAELNQRYRGYKLIRVLRADTYPNCTNREVTEAHELLATVRMQETERQQVDVRENGCTWSVYKTFKVWRAYLVFGVAKDKAFEELNRRLAEVQAIAEDAIKRGEKTAQALREAEKVSKTFQNDYQKATKEQLEAQAAMNAAQTVAKKMEADIAKIRKEIGEARYKEIVGA